MSDQFIMRRTQLITLDDQEEVDSLNAACDRMEKLTGKKWSINKWMKKNAEIEAREGRKNEN
ncbi:hypothetical protein [Cellvibrio polysaccharolyticus]|uniref:Uncharacterized protein n=1 Tax=Cellvibrio polysaccharolyticus TaxID=2082724 RepID=A0A928V2E3_9GAMM|nr:hypothetical protein [Cellvibrio polysaccharolyticus]MBE8715701.1 hypothetical protein [Cellvibrio polysaccharolyticus]